jgi:RNA polymerase sigma-70 factor (ECF subfamily)
VNAFKQEGERMETVAFTAAAEQYQDMVYRIALSHLGNVQDAEDAVQEVFLKLYRQNAPPTGDSLR